MCSYYNSFALGIQGESLKVIKTGRVIGIALEEFGEGSSKFQVPSSKLDKEGKILERQKIKGSSEFEDVKRETLDVRSRNEQSEPSHVLRLTSHVPRTGKVLVFVNPHYWVNPQENDELRMTSDELKKSQQELDGAMRRGGREKKKRTEMQN